MFGVAPWRQKYPLQWGTPWSSVELVTCASQMRMHLADFKPYTELYNPKLLFGTVSSAALLTFLPVLQDHNAFVASGGDADKFDWGAHMGPHYSKFLPNLGRLYSIQFVKKLYQYYCVNNFDVVIADRYTKDIVRSAARKFNRYGRSLVFLSETFQMALGADVLYRLSVLTVDSAMELRNWFSNKQREFDLIFAGQWFVKKALKMCIGSLVGAAGFAMGSSVDQRFMILGGLMASLSELAAAPVCDFLLGP